MLCPSLTDVFFFEIRRIWTAVALGRVSAEYGQEEESQMGNYMGQPTGPYPPASGYPDQAPRAPLNFPSPAPPPSAFGPPPPPPFFPTGPTGGFPLSGFGGPPPAAHYPPLCAALEAAGIKLRHLAEPVVYVGFGLLVIWLLKTLLLPHLHLFTATFKSEEARSAIDDLTTTVLQAVETGVCLPNVACKLGQKASLAPVLPRLLRLFETKKDDRESPVAIFKMAALKKINDCEAFECTPAKKEHIKKNN
ncbi:hypothetical protein AAG570_007616 [Ranatra chinensis]|uniref:Uncharacterized protein n=1 Tax=Ranatra chinensis TaxID=642074 RepID=A0ABD0XVC0_9HEMI